MFNRFNVAAIIADKMRYINAPDGCAVATPSAAYSTGTWEATYAERSIGGRTINMIAQKHAFPRFLIRKEIDSMKAFTKDTGKKATLENGYMPQHITVGDPAAIERHIIKGTMATTGAIARTAAKTTSTDLAAATAPDAILTSDYGVVYGNTTWGLEHATYGSGKGKSFRKFEDTVREDMAQQLTSRVNTGLYSDGTANQIDGLAYWRKTSGTKWNSNDIAATDTFLQGLASTCTEGEFDYDKFCEYADDTEQGVIAATRSEGLYPNFFMCSTALWRKIKKWVVNIQTHLLEKPADNNFVHYGTPREYVVIDGVCVFKDAHLDTLLSTNFGLGYFGNADYFELIMHPDFNFDSIDSQVYDGSPAPDAVIEKYDLPTYLYKKGGKAIVLINLYYARPRNLNYVTVT